MFLLRDLPRPETFVRFEAAFGAVDIEAVCHFLGVLRAGSDLLNALDGFLETHALRHGRWITLVLLMRETDNTASPSDLADKQGVTRATMSGLLDGLEGDGLVERIADSRDGRGSLARLTKAGRAKLDAIMPDYYARVARLFEGVARSDIARSAEVIGTMQNRAPTLAER